MKRFLEAGALLLLASLLTACGPDVARWKEEVMLHDGRMIVVERMASREHSGFPNANRGRYLEFELKYSPMNVMWHTDKGIQHVSFEVFDGVPYMVLHVGNELAFCKGKADSILPIRIIKLQDGQWVDVPQENFPLDQANINLYFSYWGNNTSEDTRGLVTWKFKEERDGYPIVRLTPDHLDAIHRPEKIREFFSIHRMTCGNFNSDTYR